jgi:hypothetical protein
MSDPIVSFAGISETYDGLTRVVDRLGLETPALDVLGRMTADLLDRW